MWTGTRIGTDAAAIGFIGAPIDEPLMVVRDEHGPLRLRQLADALLARSGRIERDLMAALAISVSARVDGIRQHMINRNVARVDPAHFSSGAGPQGQQQSLAAEPEPDATYRSEFGETREDRADHTADGFVRMETNLAVLVTPHEADREPAAQLATRGLVANAAEQACAQHMQLRLTHRALEAKQQSIVEHGRVIDAVGVGDQRVSEAAEVEQAIPIGVVAREARDFKAEHDSDMSKCYLRGEPRETIALDDAGAGHAEVFIDDDDLLLRPPERRCPRRQGILALCRLTIVLDLSGRGLSKIDVGGAAQM